MKAKADKIENCQAVLEVEAEPEEVERSLEEAYRNLVKRADVPGFRRGKAPRVMLERYIGRERLLEEALDRLVPQLLNRAIEEQGIDAIAQPEVEVIQTDPVTFKATIPLRPTVELGNYREISIAPEPVEVGDEDVNKIIEQLRYQHAPWQPVARPVKLGDLLTIDIEGSVEGKPVLKQKGVEYEALQGSPFPVPGFAEKLEGMEKEQEKEFNISLPEDYATKELAGKECHFKVLVTEIKEKKLPELDDEFAKSIGQGFETLDSLRQRVASNLRIRAEQQARRRHEEKVIEAVMEHAQVSFPPILVEREIDGLIRELSREVSLEDYLRSRRKTEEELRQEFKPVATKRVAQSLVLSKVVEEEKIEVSDEELNAEIDELAQGAGERGEELKKQFDYPATRQSLKEAMLVRKAVKRLVEMASVESNEGVKKWNQEE